MFATLLIMIVFYLTRDSSSSSVGGQISFATAMVAVPFFLLASIIQNRFHIDFGDRSSIQSMSFVFAVNLFSYLALVSVVYVLIRLVTWLWKVLRK